MNVIHNKLSTYMTSEGYLDWSAKYSGSLTGAEVTGSNRLEPSNTTEEFLIKLEGSKIDDSSTLDLIEVSSIEAGYSASAGL